MQFGIRCRGISNTKTQGHSTDSAPINLTGKILFNLDQDQVTGMVFVDFRKAFDIIDHHVLPKKLELYRVSDVAVSWV